MSVTLYEFNPRWSTARWFDIGGPCFKLNYGRRVRFVWLWNLFNRHTADGDHWWGIGVFQIGNRHLFYVGHNGVSIAFVGRTA